MIEMEGIPSWCGIPLTGGFHIGAKALLVIELIWFGYIARLCQWRGRGSSLFTCPSDFYLPLQRLEGGGWESTPSVQVLRIREFIPDPRSRVRLFPSRILDPNFFHPGSRIHIKEFKYFNPKNYFSSSRKYDPGCLSRIRVLIFYPSRIPDPGVKKRHQIPDPDPQHCSVRTAYST